jgi:hypothetical protein
MLVIEIVAAQPVCGLLRICGAHPFNAIAPSVATLRHPVFPVSAKCRSRL